LELGTLKYLVTNEKCGPCPLDDEGAEPPSPQELARQLVANVWPELYGDLLAMVAAAIDAAPDEETQAYWQAVYDALTEWFH